MDFQALDLRDGQQHPDDTAAIARPATHAIAASRKDSVRSWRTSRARPAPIASLTANSRRRAAERATRRFATLAQAISSTHGHQRHQHA